jgi:hypothetical protein
VYARQAKAMNAAGIIPIFSLDNRLAASGEGLSAPIPCALPQDDLVAALAGTTVRLPRVVRSRRCAADFILVP